MIESYSFKKIPNGQNMETPNIKFQMTQYFNAQVNSQYIKREDAKRRRREEQPAAKTRQSTLNNQLSSA
jgi:hypothetical protein